MAVVATVMATVAIILILWQPSCRTGLPHSSLQEDEVPVTEQEHGKLRQP